MKVFRVTFLILLAALLCVADAAVAQTVTKVEVRSGILVGKSDHSVFIRGKDGKVLEYQAAPGATAIVDGKEVGLADLKVGTMLSATWETTEMPVEVVTYTVREGEVVKVEGSNLTWKEKGALHTKTIPKGFRFQLEGREVPVTDLKPGMKLSTTIVTTDAAMVTETKRAGSVVGSTAHPRAAAPAAEPAPQKKLPKTAGPLPLLALIGAASLAAGAGLRAYRRSH